MSRRQTLPLRNVSIFLVRKGCRVRKVICTSERHPYMSYIQLFSERARRKKSFGKRCSSANSSRRRSEQNDMIVGMFLASGMWAAGKKSDLRILFSRYSRRMDGQDGRMDSHGADDGCRQMRKREA